MKTHEFTDEELTTIRAALGAYKKKIDDDTKNAEDRGVHLPAWLALSKEKELERINKILRVL
jgi:hypothetical protein